MGLAIAALVCIHETWFVLAGSKVLAPWDAGFKARALRTVIFSLATAPATTSSLEKKKKCLRLWEAMDHIHYITHRGTAAEAAVACFFT